MAHVNSSVDLRPVVLVLVGSLGIQASAVVSSTLFAELGTVAVSTFRLVVAALVTLPVAAPKLVDVSPHSWLILTLAALIGVVIPYIADTLAARITSAQVVGTLFALDPVVGSILGWLFMGDELTARMLVGIPMVALAGAVITWRSKPRSEAGGSAARPQVQE